MRGVQIKLSFARHNLFLLFSHVISEKLPQSTGVQNECDLCDQYDITTVS